MKWTTACAAVAALVTPLALLSQSNRTASHNITAIRHWNTAGTTRIAIEVSGEFEYRTDRLHDPERVYYDILDSKPKFDNKRLYTEDVDDPFVKRIRVAETSPGVTRVVFDLTGPADVGASILTSPNRLIVELRRPVTLPSSAVPASTTPAATDPEPVAPTPVPDPVKPTVAKYNPPATVANPPASKSEPAAMEPSVTMPVPPPTQAPVTVSALTEPAKPVAPTPVSAPSSGASSSGPGAVGKPARRTSGGETSLVRALGLKLQRIVIDPGHGGHDEGTQGPKGLLEKDLVLDVSQRLGKLIAEKMGTEVIYTRSDDTFIPLQGRTALANDKKADLFLSIHANSSPAPAITGVETYYLNFTEAKDALAVASRENAGAAQSVFDLHDIVEKISAHDKASESRDFAERIQAALFAFSAKTFPTEKNRGVKKAPFVVLIGANMPSVLAEIGFVSNSREEALLMKPEYRQKLAEALFRGVSKYAESLSHFQVAAN